MITIASNLQRLCCTTTCAPHHTYFISKRPATIIKSNIWIYMEDSRKLLLYNNFNPRRHRNGLLDFRGFGSVDV